MKYKNKKTEIETDKKKEREKKKLVEKDRKVGKKMRPKKRYLIK